MFAKEVLFQNAKIRRKKVLFDVKINFQKQEKSMFKKLTKLKKLDRFEIDKAESDKEDIPLFNRKHRTNIRSIEYIHTGTLKFLDLP